jgi:hypothetical protein
MAKSTAPLHKLNSIGNLLKQITLPMVFPTLTKDKTTGSILLIIILISLSTLIIDEAIGHSSKHIIR